MLVITFSRVKSNIRENPPFLRRWKKRDDSLVFGNNNEVKIIKSSGYQDFIVGSVGSWYSVIWSLWFDLCLLCKGERRERVIFLTYFSNFLDFIVWGKSVICWCLFIFKKLGKFEKQTMKLCDALSMIS